MALLDFVTVVRCKCAISISLRKRLVSQTKIFRIAMCLQLTFRIIIPFQRRFNYHSLFDGWRVYYDAIENGY